MNVGIICICTGTAKGGCETGACPIPAAGDASARKSLIVVSYANRAVRIVLGLCNLAAAFLYAANWSRAYPLSLSAPLYSIASVPVFLVGTFPLVWLTGTWGFTAFYAQ